MSRVCNFVGLLRPNRAGQLCKLLHCICSGIIFSKLELGQALRFWPVTFLPWEVDLSPLDLEHLYYTGCHVAKFSTKFQRSRTIRSWVIDNLANFRRLLLFFFQYRPTLTQKTKIELNQIRGRHSTSIGTQGTTLDFTYFASFPTQSCGNASGGFYTDAAFALWPSVSHLGRDRKRVFKMSSYTGSHNAPNC